MPGRPFLQIPGPTLVPDRIVRAMAQPIIDHRGPKFAALVHDCLDGLKEVFQTTRGHVVLYPGSGTGAWEAAVVNTLSPGDRVLACVNGHFAAGFAKTAAAYGIEVDRLELEYGAGVSAAEIAARLRADTAHEMRAVLVVHNETSTGVTSSVAAVRNALDAAQHPALLLVDTVSSLASIDFRLDEWGVDVALTGPQKGLMLPPGMAILGISERAVRAGEKAKCPRSFWDWQPILERNKRGEYPYTPATMLLFGLRDPFGLIRDEVESGLREQVPDTDVVSIAVLGPPKFLTLGRKAEDGAQLIVTHFAFCLRARLSVLFAEGRKGEVIEATLTFLFANVDAPGKQRFRRHFDVHGEAENGFDDARFKQRFLAFRAEQAESQP